MDNSDSDSNSKDREDSQETFIMNRRMFIEVSSLPTGQVDLKHTLEVLPRVFDDPTNINHCGLFFIHMKNGKAVKKKHQPKENTSRGYHCSSCDEHRISG